MDFGRYASALRESVANGTISLEEYEAKLGAVYAAQTVAELEVLVPSLSARPARPARNVPLVIGLTVGLLVVVGAVTGFALRSPAHRAAPALRGNGPAKALIAAHRASGATSTPSAPTSTATPPTTAPAGPTSAANAPTAQAASPQPSVPPTAPQEAQPPTGWPGNGTVAVLWVDVSAGSFAVDTWEHDVTYPICSHFEAISPGGKSSGLSGLAAGDFATLTTSPTGLCATSVRVLGPPSATECSASGYGGDGTVVLLGSNEDAHSLIYRGVDSSFVQAVRWCGTLTVVGADTRPALLSAIPPGTIVTTDLSSSDWVTAVSVGQP